jgi:hypothetical protein
LHFPTTYFTTPELEDLVDLTSRTDGKTLELTFIRPCIILKKKHIEIFMPVC